MKPFRYRPSFGLKPRRWLTQLVVVLYMAGSSLQVVNAAGGAGTITADPNAGANRPTIDASANGVPIINIARPNDKGISHNKYQDLNIPQQGAILNNAGVETNTQLAGWIDKNNAYAPGDSARLILNEVTGQNASQLNGYLEVAGQRADVIIANPNGIYGANFGFINTSRAMLTTGIPEFDAAGNLRSFAVRSGKVVIDGDPNSANPNLGAYANLTDQFDILARAVQINAQVFAKKLNIITGANRVNYNDLTTEKIAADPNDETPLVALDIAALGGMYANRIRLVGTEAGLGVNTRGDIAAGIDGFTLTSEGKVVMNGKTTSEAAIAINATQGITNNGTLHAEDNATLTTREAIENTGLLASHKDIALTADGKITNTGVIAAGLDTQGNFTNTNANLTATAGTDIAMTGGQNYAGKNIAFNAQNLDLSRATTQASNVTLTSRTGDIIHRNAKLGADTLVITAPGTFDNTAGQINAANITLTAQKLLNNATGSIAQTGNGTLSLTIADALANTQGSITSAGELLITANTLTSNNGNIAANNTLAITTRNGLDNTSGQIFTYGNLTLTNQAGSFINTSGLIQTGNVLTLQNQNNALSNTDGKILSTGNLTLLTRNLDNTRGNIGTDAALVLTLTNALTNDSGTITSGNNITLTAASLDNTSGYLDANGSLITNLTGSLNNTEGQIISRNGALSLIAANLDNTDGFIATSSSLALNIAQTYNNANGTLNAEGDLSVRAASISNAGEISTNAGALTLTATAGDITNTGTLNAHGNITLTAANGTLGNTGTDAIINAGNNLALDAKTLDNTSGQIVATNNARITLTDTNGTLNNTRGNISANNDLTLTTPGNLINTDGEITAAAGNLTLNAAGPITNTGIYARIAAGNALNLTTANALDNSDGSIFSQGNLTLSTGTAALNNTWGYIGTTGTDHIANVTLTAGDLDNTQGTLTSTGSLTLNAASLANLGYYAQIYSADNATITLANNFDNTYGSLRTGGQLTLDLHGTLDNTLAEILANGNLNIATHNGLIDNTAGYIGGNANATLEAATLTNTLQGEISLSGSTNIALTGTLYNTTDANLLSGGKITITAATVDNNYGTLKSGGGIDATLTGDWINNNYAILAAGDQGLRVTAANFDNSTGTIKTTGSITIATPGIISNAAGTIITDTDATLSAAAISNALGYISTNNALTLNATTGGLDNRYGTLTAGGQTHITLATDLLNAYGLILGNGIDLITRHLDNTAGYIGSTDATTLALSGTLFNINGGGIAADHTLALTAQTIVNTNAGTTGGIFGNADLNLTTTTGALDNTAGRISNFGNTTLTLATDLYNQGGALASGSNLTLAAQNIDNSANGYLTANNNATLTLTNSLNNNTGTILTGASLSLHTLHSSLINQDGLIQAGEDLTLTSANGIDNQTGTLRSYGNQTLTTGSASLNNANGLIQSGSNLSITNTTAATLNNTHGYITASGTLTIENRESKIENTTGVIATGAAGNATIATETLTNTNGALIAGQNLTLTIANGNLTLDSTQEIWANNNLILTLQNGSFTNSGTDLLAYGLATINASGNITNNAGALLNAGGLNLTTTTGTLTNLGRIDADIISTTSDYLDNRSVIIGQIVLLDARELHNTGTGALIASTQYLGLFTSDLLSNERTPGASTTTTGANIFTLGDLTIAGRGGVDTTGTPRARAGRILNASSSIEASGDVLIYASDFINERDTFAVSQVETNRQFVSEGWDYFPGKLAPEYSGRQTRLDYTIVETEDHVSADSPEARLSAGGTVRLNLANAAYNNYSTIASNDLVFDMPAAQFIQTSAALHHYVSYEDATYYMREWGGSWSGWQDKGHYAYNLSDHNTDTLIGNISARTTGANITGTIGSLTNRSSHTAPDTHVSGLTLDSVSGKDIAGHDITNNDDDTTVTGNDHSIDGTGTDADTTLTPVTPPSGDGSEGRIPGGKTLPTLVITAPGEVNFTLPQNPLYTVNTDPHAQYLIVTDPRFTNWDNYTSSDYFFQRMGVDPQQMHKRLGDGFYENRLILDQISALTGRCYVGDYRSEDEQFKGLMDHAYDVSIAFELRPGIALTADQVANLDKDIVWMVETNVNGQTVLAPVIYLSKATRATIESGAVIAATNIDLTINGDVSNQGTIRADRDMRLQAANILNDGGNLKTGGNMTLVAKTDITSYAGNIQAGSNATLVAGRDIRLASVADTTDYGIGKGQGNTPLATRTTTRNQTLSAGGDLSMQAGRDLTLTGVATTAGGDATLIAGRNLTLDTTKSINRLDANLGSGSYLKTEQVTHTLTTLEAGGNLALRAGTPGTDSAPASLGNINLASAQLNAGGNTTLVATGNINITAEKDRDYSDKKTGTSKQMDHALHDDETVRGATIQSGGNIALSAGEATLTPGTNSGNVNIASGYLASQNGNITVAATNDITLTTTSEHHETLSESYRKTSSLTSTKTTTTRDHTTYDAAVGATLSGDSVAMQAGHDLTVQGSTVAATNEVTLKAGNNINITAATETYTDEHYSKTTKSGILSASVTTLSVGKQSQESTDTAQGTLAKGSLIGSNEGRVSVIAGSDVTLVGSQIVSQTGIGIDAANINITVAAQTDTTTHSEQIKQSGVSFAIRGGPFEALYAAEGKQMIGAEEVKDARLSELDRLRNSTGWLINTDGLAAAGSAPWQSTIAMTYGNHSQAMTNTQETTTHNGSSLNTAGDLTLIARGKDGNGGDINIAGSYLSAGDTLAMKAARDITITETLDSRTNTTITQINDTQIHGSAVTTNRKGDSNQYATQTQANGSTLTADNVTMVAGRDITVRGSTIAADHDINLDAVRDVRIETATETQYATFDQKQRTNGVFDSGRIAVTFGQRNIGYGQDEYSTAAVGSLIGTTGGRINIHSGRETRIVGSELFSQTGIGIDADSISILAAEQTASSHQRQRSSEGGLTVQVRGGIVDLAMNIVDSIDRAKEVDDDRLTGLYAARAARNGYEIYKAVNPANGGTPNINIEVAASVGAKSSGNQGNSQNISFVGSSLSTEGDITLLARGSSTGANSGNIHIAGSDISGNNITLGAANNILVESAADAYLSNSTNSNQGWAVGVAFGFGTQGMGLSIFAEGYKGQGYENGNGTNYKNSHITAADTLTIISGNDTTLAGATASGKRIIADIGGDLNLISQQSSDYYDAKQEQMSGKVQVSVMGGGGGASASYNQSQTTNDYLSVTEQTGLYAGDEGFHINVGGNTDLKGAVIASQADASKNYLSTETLTFSDLENHANYDANGFGISAAYSWSGNSNDSAQGTSGGSSAQPNVEAGQHGDTPGSTFTPGLSLPVRQSDEASSTTHSAISDGTIIVRSDYDENGNRIKDSLAGLSNDVNNASGSLENKFDLDKIQTNQELGKLVGEEGFNAVGDLSDKILTHFANNVGNAVNKGDIEGTLDSKSEFDASYQIWGEGGFGKIIAHAGIGFLEAQLGGGDGLSGAMGAGISEASGRLYSSENNISGYVLKPLIGGLVGGQNGTATANDAFKYNDLQHISPSTWAGLFRTSPENLRAIAEFNAQKLNEASTATGIPVEKLITAAGDERFREDQRESAKGIVIGYSILLTPAIAAEASGAAITYAGAEGLSALGIGASTDAMIFGLSGMMRQGALNAIDEKPLTTDLDQAFAQDAALGGTSSLIFRGGGIIYSNYFAAERTALTSENVTYRALNTKDAARIQSGLGLEAKNPLGNWALDEHITLGSQRSSWLNDPWIATSRELEVARGFDSGNGIIKIDLTKVPSQQLQAWELFPRVNGAEGLPYHYSIWQQEVSILKEIPREAITIIKTPGL